MHEVRDRSQLRTKKRRNGKQESSHHQKSCLNTSQNKRSSLVVQWVKDPALSMLWCGSQTWLGSHAAVAVAVAGTCSSNSTPSLGTSICHLYGPRKTKRRLKNERKKNKRKKEVFPMMLADVRVLFPWESLRKLHLLAPWCRMVFEVLCLCW